MLFAKIHFSAKKTDSSGFFFVVRLIFLKNNILILLAVDKETLRICLNDRVEYPVNGLPSAIRQSGHDAYRYENEESIMTAQGISLSERGVHISLHTFNVAFATRYDQSDAFVSHLCPIPEKECLKRSGHIVPPQWRHNQYHVVIGQVVDVVFDARISDQTGIKADIEEAVAKSWNRKKTISANHRDRR